MVRPCSLARLTFTELQAARLPPQNCKCSVSFFSFFFFFFPVNHISSDAILTKTLFKTCHDIE